MEKMILEKKKIVAIDFQKNVVYGLETAPKVWDLKKLLKVVNCATIKETKKLKEAMVGFQVELGEWQPIST